MARRGRKPNVATDTIVNTILASESGTVTTADFSGVTAKRLNDLAGEGVLVIRKKTAPILNEDGTVSRGRPRILFGLSASARKRAKREAAKAAA